MPIYETTLPDGQPLQVIGPPGATPQEISQAAIQIASQQTPPPSTITPNYTLGRAITGGWDTGVERVKSTFGDVIPAMAANALGFEDYAKRQMEEARRSEEKIARMYTPEFESFKDVDSLGGAARFVAGTIAEQGPNLLTMIGSGGVPAIGAKLTAKKFALELAKKYPKMPTKEIIKRVAKRQGLAQNVGVFLGSYSLNAPEVFNNIYQETGQLETGTSLLFGAAAASLDSVLPATMLKKLTPIQKTDIAGALLLKSGANPSLVNKVFTGMAKGAATEGVTEGMQEAISISAENFVAGNPQIFGSEDWDRIMESAVRGAIAGGFFRGVSSPIEGSESESLLNTLDKPTGTPGLDTGDVELNAMFKRRKEAADIQGLTIIKPDIQEEFKEAIKISEKMIEGQAVSVREVFNYNPKTNKWTKVREELVAEAVKEVDDDDEADIELPYEGFRPPEGMTIEEGIAYYNGLDEIEQINYEPPQETIQDEPTTIDAVDRNKIIRGSDVLPLESATGETAAELGSPVGGKVEVDTGPVSPTGERADVVNPALEETVEEAWEEMSISEIPFAKLSSENKQRLREAKEDGELTGQLVDQIDGELGFQESRTDTEGTGQTAETITTELVQEFGPNVNRMQERGRLVVVDSVEQLPANVTMSSTANGAFDNNSGISYLVANRIQKGQGRRILLHEIGEHYGLERMVGKDYTALLNRLKTLRKQNADIDALFGEVQELYPELEVNSKPFLQEVMAKLGERAPNNTLFRRMVGAVKNFLRRLGIYDVNRFSDVDIQDMILNSLRVSLAENTGKSLASSTSDTPAVQMSKKYMGKAKANLKTFISMLRNKYLSDMDKMPNTVVKEMLQNSADAIKPLIEQGKMEQGNIDIKVNKDTRTITMRDNGIGMTKETLGGVFLEIGGTLKEITDKGPAGGFGFAKAILLYGSGDINVTTMRDGKISNLRTTGETLMRAFVSEDKIGIPIDILTTEEYFNEQAKFDAMFPEGHGTQITVTIPKTYINNKGKEKEIYISQNLDKFFYESLLNSPLFQNINVTFEILKTTSGVDLNNDSFFETGQGNKVNIGQNFPLDEFIPVFDVPYKWGNVKVYKSINENFETENKTYNVTVLSNGLFQFKDDIPLDFERPNDEVIPFEYYMDVEPAVKAGNPAYPFDPDRRSFTEQAEKDIEDIKNGLYVLHKNQSLKDDSISFGGLEQYTLNKDGSITVSKKILLSSEQKEGLLKESIPEGTKVEIKDGKLVIGNKKVPIRTPEDLKNAVVSSAEIVIPKDAIDYKKPVLHNNVETKLSQNQFAPIQEVLREEFPTIVENGYATGFDAFINEIGASFIILRDQVVRLGEAGLLIDTARNYKELNKAAIGVSIDTEYAGVNLVVPFEGAFVNPFMADALFEIDPALLITSEGTRRLQREAGYGISGTMIHELAHYQERNHEAGFTKEMQKLALKLKATEKFVAKNQPFNSFGAVEKRIIKAVEKNFEMIKVAHEILKNTEGENRNVTRLIGQRFKDGIRETSAESVPKNMVTPREKGLPGRDRIPGDTRKGDTTGERERQLESVSPESKTTQESRVDNKNIQFSKENPPGGVNPTQDNALFKYAGDLQQKLPLPTKDYIKGVWDKVTELPTSIKDAWTGMLGLQAMVDLYDKYLPSIKKLMNTLERRAAEVETTRAEVDVLGNLGMDVIQGKERRLIDYDKKTGQVKIGDNGQVVLTDKTTSRKYTDGQLKTWEQTTYKLSERDVDPRDQANFTDPDVMKFFNLPPELQALSIAYTEKFEQYGNNLLDAYKTAAEKAVKKDESAQEVVERVVKEFTENRLKFYHPFRRRGDYVLSYVSNENLTEHNEIMEQIENSDESKDQKAFRKAEEFKRYQPLVQTSRYETKAAYVEAAIRQESADGITVLKAEIDPENKSFRVSGEGAVGIMQEVTGILQKTDEEGKPLVDEAVIKEVAGLFLDALPSQSIKQQSRQRLGTGGYVEDLVGGFIDLGARMATQVANLKYIPEINENIADVGTENATMQADLDPTNPKDASLQTSLSSVVERLEDSKSFFHNPVAGPISSRFAYLSYLTSIAGNVSSALVNATQLAIIVYPTLVAEYGFGMANRVMGQAFSYYFGGGKDSNRGFLPDQSFGMKDGKLRTDLPEDLQQLYKTGIDNSVFRRGVGYELTEMRKTNAKDFVGTKAKFDALMGWMFQNTERMNREVTYIAGYLAAKEKGASFEVAERKSRELTRRSHGTALPEIGPRFFQENFGKVMFTFKRYGHAMLHLLFKAFNDAYRGETKEVRNIARKQILGIYGASFTFAGLQGAPLYGFTQALAEVMYAMFGDEDEPFDFEESTREIFGDIGYRGPLNKLLNVDIASRTGFANLIWREDPRRISEVGLMQYVLEQGLGPSFSYGLSVNRGLQDMARGNIYRGVEQTLPAFARNPMKAIRYATEGAVNRKGAEIVPLNPLDGFLQIFGFTNEDLSLQYARNQSMKQAEKNFNARRSGLLTAHYLARKNGDFDMMREVQDKINDFNRSTIGSANPITGSTLKRSYKNKEDSINNSVGGITLNKRIETAVRDKMGS